MLYLTIKEWFTNSVKLVMDVMSLMKYDAPFICYSYISISTNHKSPANNKWTNFEKTHYLYLSGIFKDYYFILLIVYFEVY